MRTRARGPASALAFVAMTLVGCASQSTAVASRSAGASPRPPGVLASPPQPSFISLPPVPALTTAERAAAERAALRDDDLLAILDLTDGGSAKVMSVSRFFFPSYVDYVDVLVTLSAPASGEVDVWLTDFDSEADDPHYRRTRVRLSLKDATRVHISVNHVRGEVLGVDVEPGPDGVDRPLVIATLTPTTEGP